MLGEAGSRDSARPPLPPGSGGTCVGEVLPIFGVGVQAGETAADEARGLLLLGRLSKLVMSPSTVRTSWQSLRSGVRSHAALRSGVRSQNPLRSDVCPTGSLGGGVPDRHRLVEQQLRCRTAPATDVASASGCRRPRSCWSRCGTTSVSDRTGISPAPGDLCGAPSAGMHICMAPSCTPVVAALASCARRTAISSDCCMQATCSRRVKTSARIHS
mmetsp:Transcript_12389/g.35186  ORF Transcript_12389/g.35186 Transcript_12389/m.35186 type:complete len:215 (+) Transcript_12389:1021-1665(+)